MLFVQKTVSDKGSYLREGDGCGREPYRMWKEGFRNMIAFYGETSFVSCLKSTCFLTPAGARA